MAKAKKTKRKGTSVADRKKRGPYCVFGPSGKLFTCFKKKQSADNVAKGMNKACSRRGTPATAVVRKQGR